MSSDLQPHPELLRKAGDPLLHWFSPKPSNGGNQQVKQVFLRFLSPVNLGTKRKWKISGTNLIWVGSVGVLFGEGNSNPLQYSCLENPMDGEAWWATVHGVTKSRTQLSDFSFTLFGEKLYVKEKTRRCGSCPSIWRVWRKNTHMLEVMTTFHILNP